MDSRLRGNDNALAIHLDVIPAKAGIHVERDLDLSHELLDARRRVVIIVLVEPSPTPPIVRAPHSSDEF